MAQFFVHFLLLFICISYAMVGWHFQFGKRGVVHAHFLSYLYLHGCVFSWFSMMKPGRMLSHPGPLKKAPLSAETLDIKFFCQN